MRIQLLFPVLVLILANGCSDMQSDFGGVYVRVENVSSFAMENIEVGFPDTLVSYGNFPSGEKSGYKEIPKAFDIAGVAMTVNKKQLQLQPIDFVGEEPLKPGLYTYLLIVEERSGDSDYSLSMDVRAD